MAAGIKPEVQRGTGGAVRRSGRRETMDRKCRGHIASRPVARVNPHVRRYEQENLAWRKECGGDGGKNVARNAEPAASKNRHAGRPSV